MGKLHELLAVVKDRQSQAKKVLDETMDKFKKRTMFVGMRKSLTLLQDNPNNAVQEAAESESKKVTTTVKATLEYALDLWAKAEDACYQVNKSNQSAMADLMFRGQVLASNVPVDELMGLSIRLTELRKLLLSMPTLDATSEWIPSPESGHDIYKTNSVTTTKTQKVIFPVTLAPATDKHPAQVKEGSKDEVIGSFSTTYYSGAATTIQMADSISAIEELIQEVKQAQMRANCVDASRDTIGARIVGVIMAPFNNNPTVH